MPLNTLIHPTAIISEDAILAPDVEVGPYVVIEGPVTIGSGTRIRARAHLVGPMTIGCHNDIGINVVLGERPQHLIYNGEPTRTEIGDHNVFRENSTVHRGTHISGVTTIGSHNYFMVNTHIAHDCRIGSYVMIANNALLAGHCEVGDRALLSGNCALHQWARIGRLGLLSGLSASTKDIPPFFILSERDVFSGVNVIGMRRAGIPSPHIQAVRSAFKILRQPGWTVTAALAQIELKLGEFEVVQEVLTFIRQSKRGICGSQHMHRNNEAEAA